jgi:uncharacterized membrane protein
MSDEPKRLEERSWFRGLVIGLVAVASLGTFAAWTIGTAQARAAERAAQGVEDAAKVAADLKAHKAEDAQSLDALRADMKAVHYDTHETQLDLRELWRSIRFDQPSGRLSKPPVPFDGGVPF